MSYPDLSNLEGLDEDENVPYELPENVPYELPKYFTFNNGIKMPAIGLGTYKICCLDIVMKVIDNALRAGYRMFDTDPLYYNEGNLNFAFKQLLPKHNLEREDIFIITKLCPWEFGSGARVAQAFNTSLTNLGLDYIDLYLIHYPGKPILRDAYINHSILLRDAWTTLTEFYKDRKVNAIGVSNFKVHHLIELMEFNQGVVPAVNQIEWHPFYNQVDLYDYCKDNNIVMQAYSPLGGPSSFELLNDPTVIRVAEKLDATPAQVLLVWSLQQDVSVIPKTCNPDRLKENITLNFTIPDEELEELNALHVRNTKFSWDPGYEYPQ